MYQYTFDELMDKIHDSDSNSLQLSFEDVIAVQKILVKNGYAVMMSGADFDDEYKISWVYAGTVGNLNYADSNNVIFCDACYIDDLAEHSYIDKEVEITEE